MRPPLTKPLTLNGAVVDEPFNGLLLDEAAEETAVHCVLDELLVLEGPKRLIGSVEVPLDVLGE